MKIHQFLIQLQIFTITMINLILKMKESGKITSMKK